MLEYKGYRGHAEFDDEAGIFFGEVIDTRDVITFEGTSVRGLQKAFRDSVDDYLDFCRERGEVPDKPFTGRLMVRLRPETHRALYVQAQLEKKSLSRLIQERLEAE